MDEKSLREGLYSAKKDLLSYRISLSTSRDKEFDTSVFKKQRKKVAQFYTAISLLLKQKKSLV